MVSRLPATILVCSTYLLTQNFCSFCWVWVKPYSVLCSASGSSHMGASKGVVQVDSHCWLSLLLHPATCISGCRGPYKSKTGGVYSTCTSTTARCLPLLAAQTPQTSWGAACMPLLAGPHKRTGRKPFSGWAPWLGQVPYTTYCFFNIPYNFYSFLSFGAFHLGHEVSPKLVSLRHAAVAARLALLAVFAARCCFLLLFAVAVCCAESACLCVCACLAGVCLLFFLGPGAPCACMFEPVPGEPAVCVAHATLLEASMMQ